MLLKKLPNDSEWVKSNPDLITARERNIYNMGIEKGAREEQRKQKEQLDQNFVKSYNDTTEILRKLKQDKIDVISARLKVENEHCLKIMLSVKDKGEAVLNLEDVYNFIYEIEEKNNSEDYMINFSIIKANEHFSDAGVESDGYIYTHGLLNEESSRTA